MRHIGTLIAAIVIGPLAWILIAYGQDRTATAFANAQSKGAFHTGDFVRPLIFLAAAGVLLGLIATLRFSPLGAVVTGVVYVMSYVWLFVDAKGLLDLFKRDLSIGGQRADPTTPVRTGTTLLVGALLLVAVASVSRWRRWPAPGAAVAEPSGGTGETDTLSLGSVDPAMFRPSGTIGAPSTPEPGAESPTTWISQPPAAPPATFFGDSSPEQGRSGSAGSAPPGPGEFGGPPEPPTVATPPADTRSGTHREPNGQLGTPPGSPWSTPLRDDPEPPTR
jgi:hypothetical protein